MKDKIRCRLIAMTPTEIIVSVEGTVRRYGLGEAVFSLDAGETSQGHLYFRHEGQRAA